MNRQNCFLKIVALVVVSVLSVGMFSGCGLITDFLMQSRPIQSIETEPEQEEVQNVEYVTDAYFDSYESTSARYDRTTGEYIEEVYVFEYHIPQINIPGEGVQQINQEIYTELVGMTNEALDLMEQYGYADIYGISYRWMVNGDIISVVLSLHYGAEYGGVRYRVYNVSIAGGSIVSDAELAAAVGMTEEEYLQTAKEIIKQNFRDYIASVGGDWLDDEFVYSQEKATLSKESIDMMMPYLNEKGELCIIACRHPIAGGECKWDDLNLIHYVPYEIYP